MIRFIKKWWLLQNLRKEILRHSMFQAFEEVSDGKRVLSFEKFFIVGSEKYQGLAKKSLRRFSRILWWRKKDNEDKLKRRIHEYYDIFEVCVKEGSIEMSQTTSGLMPSVATPQADKINGLFGLL